VQRYRQRISGPLLDRIDIHVEVPLVEYRDLAKTEPSESSAGIRVRVEAARAIQKRRLEGSTARTIADLAGSDNITADHLLEAISYRTLDRDLLS
jgi:predicted ATPase with chaperone activity